MTLHIVLSVILVLVLVLRQGIRPHTYYLALAVGFPVCCVMGVTYSLRVASAKAETSVTAPLGSINVDC